MTDETRSPSGVRIDDRGWGALYSDWGPRLAVAKLSARNYDVSRASQVPFYYVYRPPAVRWPSPGGAPALMQSLCNRTEDCGALR
jgi:hypothetical protein